MERKRIRRSVPLSAVFFVLIATMKSSAAGTDSRSDTRALLAFISMADKTSSLSSSWNSDNPFYNWTGVTWGRPENRVISLSLPNRNLSGLISPFIGNLTFLVSLNLSGNDLAGALPSAAFLHLHRLRYLDLSFNSLSSSIPDSLCRLPKLSVLNLEDNSLSGVVPSSLFNSSTLQSLRLSRNRLSGNLPSTLFLPGLKKLDFAENLLEGDIPNSVGGLSSLVYLEFYNNQLSGKLPPEIGNLTRLEYLSLEANNFTGEIPASFGNLSNLRELYIRQTQISGEIPDELGQLQNLEILFLGQNQLSGHSFPAAIYNMSSLLRLDLGANILLSGNLPGDFGRRLPPNLYGLYLNVNNFSGQIPASLGNASKLQVLDLSYNAFSDGVPEELGLLEELTNFMAHGNLYLSGNLNFLGALSRCKSLIELNLMENDFHGTLPAAAISNFSNLEKFIVQDNRLEGEIPKTIGNLTALRVIVLSYNKFSGAIPPEIGQMPNIQRVYFEVNNLRGPLPLELGFARNLNLLFLQVNRISGSIVDSIGNLSRMQILNMAENQLKGEIPLGLWKLSEVNDLNLSHNRLQGSLSPAMKTLGKVTKFDLSANNLSGVIPDAIGEMLMLDYVSLAKNKLFGMIPASIGSIVNLRTLDLSFNALFGNVPDSMRNLRNLETLNLSFNNLEGRLPYGGLFSKATKGISAASFAGNPRLCGASYFGLPAACPTPHKRSKVVFIVSVVTSISLLLVFLAVLFWVIALRIRKENKKKIAKEDQNINSQYPTISLRELGIATGGFKEDNLLGSGHYGKVFKGILSDGNPVAVKVLNAEMGDAAWRSFDAECIVLRSVRHRNLIPVITTCSNVEFRGIVLPFMPYGSLESWLHPEVRLSLSQMVSIADDVAAALEYLHHGCSPPVLHCDVKSSNVLLDEDMTARLGDFGIAKVALQQGTSATRTSAAGTFGYMAPEYGMAARVTAKGDVYSFGVLLMEMFTGVSPRDNRFLGGEMNLRGWVEKMFEGGAKDVVSASLLRDEQEEGGAIKTRRLNCLAEIIKLGIECSSESRKERPDMVEVSARIKRTRHTYQI